MLIVVVPTGGKAGGGNRQKRGKKLGKVGGNLPVAHRQMRVDPDDATPANLANVEMVFVIIFVFVFVFIFVFRKVPKVLDRPGTL